MTIDDFHVDILQLAQHVAILGQRERHQPANEASAVLAVLVGCLTDENPRLLRLLNTMTTIVAIIGVENRTYTIATLQRQMDTILDAVHRTHPEPRPRSAGDN